MCTSPADRTTASRSVSGPRIVSPGGMGVSSSRDGVGVTIVTGPPCAARAPVIPRMLGTIPPSRTGSSPLQRWSHPSRPRARAGRSGRRPGGNCRSRGGHGRSRSLAWFTCVPIRFPLGSVPRGRMRSIATASACDRSWRRASSGRPDFSRESATVDRHPSACRVPSANRSGPHSATTSAARRPIAVALGGRQAGHPAQGVRPAPPRRAGRSARPVVPGGSGTRVSTQPARSETSRGSPHAAASLTTRPQGSIRLGWTNAEA